MNNPVQAPLDTRAKDYDTTDKSNDSIDHIANLEEASILAGETEGTASRCQAPKAQLKTQPWPLSFVEMTASPWSIWARRNAAAVQVKPTKPERKTARKQENVKEIQSRSKAISYLDDHHQQNSPDQAVKTIKQNTGTMKVVKQVPSGDMVFDGANELWKELQLDLKTLAKIAKEEDRYWAELLLRPLPADSAPPAKTKLPPFKAKPDSTPQLQDVNPQDLQTRPSDYESIGLHTAAVNVVLPIPDDRSPAAPEIQRVKVYKSGKTINSIGGFPDEVEVRPSIPGLTLPTTLIPTQSNAPLQFADSEKKLASGESTFMAPEAGPKKEAEPQVADVIETNKVMRKENVDNKSTSREETIKTPVKETASRLTTRKKNGVGNAGPDHFLNLLDLVRRK